MNDLFSVHALRQGSGFFSHLPSAAVALRTMNGIDIAALFGWPCGPLCAASPPSPAPVRPQPSLRWHNSSFGLDKCPRASIVWFGLPLHTIDHDQSARD